MMIQRILIVDDQLESCKFFANFISDIRVECSIETATSVEEAKIKIKESSKSFDAVIVDLEYRPHPIDYKGKFAGIGLIKFIFDYSPKSLIMPYSAFSFDNSEIQEEFIDKLGHIKFDTLKETFIEKKEDAQQKILEKLIVNNSFEQQVFRKVNVLSEEQIKLFAWRSALRILPYLGSEGNFNFWKATDRQKHLYSVFNVLDIAAYKSDETYGTAFRAADIAAIAQNRTNAISIIIKMARIATKLSGFYDKYSSFAIASVIEYTCYTISCNEMLRSAIINDIEIIKQGGGALSTEIYGNIWINFMQALDKEECGYWKNLIQQFFNDGVVKNKEALKRRLNIPLEIRNKGAIWVAEYLNEPLKNKKDILKPQTRNQTDSTIELVPNIEISKVDLKDKRIKGFISYSHDEDDHLFVEPLISAIRKKIKGLNEFDHTWVDKEIKVGEDWFERIHVAMKDADFCILLISDSFFNSEFIKREELPILLAKQEVRTCEVIPVIVTECFFDCHPELNKSQFYTPNWEDFGFEFKNDIMPFSKLFNDQNKPIMNKTNTYCSKLVAEIRAKFDSRLEYI